MTVMPRPKIAFLFPGQGAQRVDAVLRAVSSNEMGRAHCELAASIIGVPLQKMLRNPALLDQTEILQPILTTAALSLALQLKSASIFPSVVSGHSLGEMIAWALIINLPIEEAIALAALRGRLMAREAKKFPGGLVALATSDVDVIQSVIEHAQKEGEMNIAAWNAPNETVLSGAEAAVRAAMAFAKDLAKRVKTAGPWHSPLLCGALSEWESALSEAAYHSSATRFNGSAHEEGFIAAENQGAKVLPTAPSFIANWSGQVESLTVETSALIANQLVRPVRWIQTLATLKRNADVVITLGPGALLRALWHKNNPLNNVAGDSFIQLFATDDVRSFADTVAALSPKLAPLTDAQ